MQMTLLCVYGVDSFIPEPEHLIEKLFHGLFSKKKPLKSDSWIQIQKMKLRSTSSAEANIPDEITWITWETKQDLEIWPFMKSLLEKWVWESAVRKLIQLPASSPPTIQIYSRIRCAVSLFIRVRRFYSVKSFNDNFCEPGRAWFSKEKMDFQSQDVSETYSILFSAKFEPFSNMFMSCARWTCGMNRFMTWLAQ